MRPPRRHRVPIPERCATCSATIPIAAFGGHVGLRKLASGFVVPCGTVTHRALGKRTSAVARGRANSRSQRREYASSGPTFETKDPLAKKFCPTKLRFLSPRVGAKRIALLP